MVIKKILIVGAGLAGAIEHFYRQGFMKYGIEVDTYIVVDQYYAALHKSVLNKILNKISADIFFFRKINEQLLQFLKNKKYDVILVFKGMELLPATVEQLKNHTAILSNYNADHPFKFYAPGSGNGNILNSLQYYDVHFSYSKKIVAQLKTSLNKNAFCIPFGYNSNVTVDQQGTSNIYSGYFSFIGAYDNQRGSYLNQLNSKALVIYGDAKWRTRNTFRPNIQKAYRNRSLYGADYINAISSSSGVLNLLRKQNLIEDSHNMRTFEVPGYGGLLISQKTSEQLEFFEEGKEAIFFETIEELKEKLEYLSKNQDVVLATKKAAYSRSVRANYSYDQRSVQLIKCLQEAF